MSFKLGRFNEAENLLDESYQKSKITRGEKDENTIRFLEYLIKDDEKLNKSKKASLHKAILNKISAE